MKTNITKLLLAMLALLFINLACATIMGDKESAPVAPPEARATSDKGQQVQPMATPDTPPEAPTQDAPSGPSEPSAPTGDRDQIDGGDLNLDNLPDWVNSYETTLVYSVSGQDATGAPVAWKMILIEKRIVEPEAYVMSTRFEDGSEEFEEMTVWTKIGDQEYMELPGFGCISSAATEDDLNEPLFSDSNILVGTLNRIRPDKEIAGRPAYVYQIRSENVPSFSFYDEEIEDMATITVQEGEVYVDQEAGFLLGIWLTGFGKVSDFGGSQEVDGEIKYSLMYNSINVPFEIVPPENCTGMDWEDEDPSSLPVLEGADEVFQLGSNFLSYTIERNVGVIKSEFKAEMEARGYTLDEESSFGTLHTQTYIGDEGTVNVMFTVIAEEGNVSVIITKE